MKRLIVLSALILGWAWHICAQSLPTWVKHTPIPQSGNFYYRVTIAEGIDYKDAYKEAFAIAIYESYSKLAGIPVNIDSDKNSIKDDIAQSISSYDGYMRLPINKVCEYCENIISGSNRKRLYVLWQVANSALDNPQFENFNDCE